jgi:DUF1680 family protein
MKILLTLTFSVAQAFGQTGAWKDRPVLDTSRSPSAVLHGVPPSAVKVTNGFWSPRRKINVDVSLPTLLELFEQNGIVDNFRRVSGRKNVARRGPVYTDSDIYKWLEAVGFIIQSGEITPQLRKAAEGVIDDIAAAQDSSGYIDTAFMGDDVSQRHTAMSRNHELYCLGHMLQAGIAWHRGTGDRKLLDVGVRMVEYLLRDFGRAGKPIFEGHPEIELSLVELYRSTGDRRYLDFAGYFLEGDPRNIEKVRASDLVYLFTIKPFTERTKLEGHAVRAMYACSGAADYYLETGDRKYWSVLTNLWQDMVGGKMYLTGGVGSRAAGEAFGDPYELPNRQAYTESCAAIGTMFWNWRMLQATGDAKFMDSFERSLYNGANSGLSLSGSLYCYRNPLDLVGDPNDRIRNPWYTTTCCPPNLQRVLASLPGYFYSTSKDGLWIHLFDNNSLKWQLEDGTPVQLTQTTRYPWEGGVEMTVSPDSPKEFTVFLRKPAWSQTTRLEVAGTPVPAFTVQKGYVAIHRIWKPGDKIKLQFDVTPRLVNSNPLVRDNLGKLAVERGPIVYAMEGLDQPAGTTVFDWYLDLVSGKSSFRQEWKPQMLGGIVTLAYKALRSGQPSRERPLYEAVAPQRFTPGEVTLIPYYTFQNREITSMQVWIPYRDVP